MATSNKLMNRCHYCGYVKSRLKRYSGDGQKYCERHYAQMYYKGKIIEKTKFDKNDIILHKDFAEIVLKNRHHAEVGRALISLDKVAIVSQFKWHLSHTGYACSNSLRKTQKKYLRLHRLITNPKNDEIVDHINRNKLDCRNQNLRICTHSENHMNSPMRIDNSSGVRGVSYSRRDKHWRSEIGFNNTKLNLGSFKTKEEAAHARRIAEEKYFKEFAPKNWEDYEK